MPRISPITSAKDLARSWRDEATRRRRLSAHDGVADALEFCAAELLEQLRPFEDPTAMLSVEAYAELRGVSTQTVRQWIHRGTLDARPNGRTWLIPQGAEPKRRKVPA